MTALFAVRYKHKILIKTTVSCKTMSPQVVWEQQMEARNTRASHLSKVTHQTNRDQGRKTQLPHLELPSVHKAVLQIHSLNRFGPSV